MAGAARRLEVGIERRAGLAVAECLQQATQIGASEVRTAEPDAMPGVPQREVAESFVRAGHQAVVDRHRVAQVTLDAGESVQLPVILAHGVDQSGHQAQDGFEGGYQAAGEQRVDETCGLCQQAEAFAKDGPATVVEPWRMHPVTRYAGLGEVPGDRRISVQQPGELLFRRAAGLVFQTVVLEAHAT